MATRTPTAWSSGRGQPRPTVLAPVQLRWTVARDPELADVVVTGEAEATTDSHYTAQADVGELKPDTHYWYAFDADGERSPVARTRTLPGPDVDHLRFAVDATGQPDSPADIGRPSSRATSA